MNCQASNPAISYFTSLAENSYKTLGLVFILAHLTYIVLAPSSGGRTHFVPLVSGNYL